MTPAMPDHARGAGVPRALLSRLFTRRGEHEAAPMTLAPADSRRTVMRRLYDDIGKFLFSNDLDLTPLNFGCAHDYLTGDDVALVVALDKALDDRRLSDGWIEDYVAAQQSRGLKSEALVALTEKVESELDRCIGLLRRSADQASSYHDSLSLGEEFNDPQQMMTHLITLTRGMITQTRQAESEMRESYREASQLRSTLRAARKASEIDHLTSLPNRRGFERRFAELHAARAGRPMTLALCDIDHFKAVNDRFGHETGDRVLKFIARHLAAMRRRGIEVARLGGEEFAILLPDCAIRAGLDELDQLRESVAARNLVDSVTRLPVGLVTFSAGATPINDGDTLRSALRRADSALYAAKHAGRNRVYAASGDGHLMPSL